MPRQKDSINQRFIDSVNSLIASNKKLNKTIISESLGISKSKFSEILNNRMSVNVELVANFCTIYDIDTTWLLTGETIAKDEKEKITESNHVSEPRAEYSNNFQAKYIKQLEAEIEYLRDQIKDKDTLIEAFQTGKIVYTDSSDKAN